MWFLQEAYDIVKKHDIPQDHDGPRHFEMGLGLMAGAIIRQVARVRGHDSGLLTAQHMHDQTRTHMHDLAAYCGDRALPWTDTKMRELEDANRLLAEQLKAAQEQAQQTLSMEDITDHLKGVALKQLWGMLGVTDQTAAVYKLQALINCHHAIGETLDKDFNFWSAPFANFIRQKVYAAWKYASG